MVGAVRVVEVVGVVKVVEKIGVVEVDGVVLQV